MLTTQTCAPCTGEAVAAAADCRRLSSNAICSFASSPFFLLTSSSCSSLLIASASWSCSSSSPAEVGRRDSNSDSRAEPVPPFHRLQHNFRLTAKRWLTKLDTQLFHVIHNNYDMKVHLACRSENAITIAICCWYKCVKQDANVYSSQ